MYVVAACFLGSFAVDLYGLIRGPEPPFRYYQFVDGALLVEVIPPFNETPSWVAKRRPILLACERMRAGEDGVADRTRRAFIRRGARYVVMFISKEYVEKAWTTHERQHAQACALLAKEEYILPARFDDTDVRGMTTTVGIVDLRKTTPAELVTLIRDKVVNSS